MSRKHTDETIEYMQQVENGELILRQEEEATLAVAVNKLTEFGWTLPPEMKVFMVDLLGKTNAVEDIDRFMYRFYTDDEYEFFNRMTKGILESPIPESIKKLVNECCMAFTSKMYVSCANNLISAIEGILSTFWPDKNNIRMMRICLEKVNELIDEKEQYVKKYVWVSYEKFIRNLYEKSDFSENEPEFTNRHWLLHGRSSYEIKEIDCIRLFNAVSSICMIAKSEQEETGAERKLCECQPAFWITDPETSKRYLVLSKQGNGGQYVETFATDTGEEYIVAKEAICNGFERGEHFAEVLIYYALGDIHYGHNLLECNFEDERDAAVGRNELYFTVKKSDAFAAKYLGRDKVISALLVMSELCHKGTPAWKELQLRIATLKDNNGE